MTAIIYMLLPAMIGTKVYMKLAEKELNIKLVLDYLCMCLFTNVISTTLIYKIAHPTFSLEESLNNIPFSIKYAVIAIIVSSIIGFVASIVAKNIEFNIRINERKTKKSKSR